MAKMKAPDKATGVSVGGQEFKVVKGVVDVPDELAPDLVAHGYETVVDDAEQSAK